jgi:type I restriction enzyme S subunit
MENRKINSHWVKQIPSNWEETKNRFIFIEINEIVGAKWKEFDLLTMGKNGVRIRNFDDGGKFPESFEDYKIVKPNNLIFCLYDMDETPRTVGISINHGMITSSYEILSVNDKNNTNFWNYFYTAIDNFKGLKPYYTGLRNVVRIDNFKNIKVYAPPLEEQNKIVEYLDKKINLIDNLIKKLEEKKRLLKEKILLKIESILLSQNIARVRLENIVTLNHRPIKRENNKNYTKIGMYNWGKGIFKYPSELGSDLGDSTFNYIKEGDLLLSGQFSWEGAVSIVEKDKNDCIASHRFHILNGNKKELLNDYLWSYFISQEGHLILNDNSFGSGGRNRPLNIGRLFKEKIPLPDFETQLEFKKLVLEYKYFQKIAQKKSNLLNEYKQSIMFEYVTGERRII